MISNSIFTVTPTNSVPLPSEFLYNLLRNTLVNPHWCVHECAKRIYNDSVCL